MSFSVDVQNPHDFAVDADALCRAAETTLRMQAVAPDTALTIRVDDDAAVAALNRSYRGVDAATDVLSFPADLPPVDDEPVYAGDIVIAYPYAAAQAAREQHPLGASLALLVVHGVLHLLGYDHATPEERAHMWSVQNTILNELNVPLDIVPALEYYDEKNDTDY